MNLRAGEEPSGEIHVHPIFWHEWGPYPFELARERNQPVILSIGAVWCYWCSVMDKTTFQDVDVIDFLNANFICIRVDNDHRPDINSRYNVGGWPTTAFLTGHGGIVAGATYLPPDQFIAMLVEVQRAYQDQKPNLYEQANNLFRQRQDQVAKIKSSSDLDPMEVQRIARRSAGIYDPLNGGFGEEPKFPSCSVLRLVLDLYRITKEEFYRIIIEKTLKGMCEGELWDSIDGGFFRFCNLANWTDAQHEKMLEDNIGLAAIYLDAWVLFEYDGYRNIANKTIDYIIGNLYDCEAIGFRGSQGAHSDYYKLSKPERMDLPNPEIDEWCYVNLSAQTASALFRAYWILERPDLLEIGRLVLDKLVTKSRDNDLFHVFKPESSESHRLMLLCDWASLLNVLMDSHNWDSSNQNSLPMAVEVASTLVSVFYDKENGGFFDTAEDKNAVGYLKLREKPLPDNLLAIEGLLKLYNATLDNAYHEIVNDSLSAFTKTYGDYGEYAASYGLLQDRFLNPQVEITVEGHPLDKSTFELLQAAGRTNVRQLLIKPLLDSNYVGQAQAVVCYASACMPPVRDPVSIQEQINSLLSVSNSDQNDIFKRFSI